MGNIQKNTSCYNILVATKGGTKCSHREMLKWMNCIIPLWRLETKLPREPCSVCTNSSINLAHSPYFSKCCNLDDLTTYIYIGTFDVQDVNIDQYDEYVNATCYFAQGSDAKGCKIEVINLEYSSSSLCEFIASRNLDNQANVTIQLPEGRYTILVYDQEFDSTMSEYPASNTTINVSTSAQVTGT